jgi:lipopolysaccharide biosynthesis glycosyltransferase
MRNAIVTAVDSNYLPAACCTLLSCAEDGQAAGQAEFFLLASDVQSIEVQNAQSFLKSRGLSVEVIVIGLEQFQPFRIDSYVSAATYSRLLLPEFFDDRWGRLLYVDADTRIMGPLQPLLNADLDRKPIGAVHDYLRYLIYGMKDSRRRLGLRIDAPYFNAGVICFDWSGTIASEFLPRARRFAVEQAHLCESHDQDALNKAFEGAWSPLDPRWNFLTVSVPDEVLRLDYPARFGPYISHFAGPLKPWMANFPELFGPHRAWYQNLLRDSPWPEFGTRLDATSGASQQESEIRAQRRILEMLRILRARFLRVSRQKRGEFLRVSGLLSPDDRDSPLGLEELFDLMIAQAAKTNIWRVDK